jgi:hypothetical protein
MALDVCPPLPSPDPVIRLAVERTAAWAKRARAVHDRVDQALFGIVQGGVDHALRAESAQRTVELDFDGYGIGGLSVGETREEMLPALAAVLVHLPADRPRYLMGVGRPEDLVEGVARGVDMFDCVLPTVTVSPIWNSHFHNPGSTWVRLNSTPLRFICRPSDSPAIRLFSGEEKVCSKQNSLPGYTGKCPDLVFLGQTQRC